MIISDFDALNRDSGTGARSTEADWLDEHSSVAENKWTTSRTTFWADDSDGNGNTLSDHSPKSMNACVRCTTDLQETANHTIEKRRYAMDIL